MDQYSSIQLTRLLCGMMFALRFGKTKASRISTKRYQRCSGIGCKIFDVVVSVREDQYYLVVFFN